MRSDARVAVIGGGGGGSVLDPGHLELDTLLAGIRIQNVLERVGPADADDRHCCLRGWCYLLEEHGLAKGDFDVAQKLINDDCRKSGALPLDICAEDGKREFDGDLPRETTSSVSR